MAIYSILLNPQRNGLIMLRADNDDPSNTDWTQMDGISWNYPMSSEIKAVGMKVDTNPTDTVIRIFTQNALGAINYHEYTVVGAASNADEWTVRNSNTHPPNNTPVMFSTDAGYRSDGDKTALYKFFDDVGTSWQTASGTTWTAEAFLLQGIDGSCAIGPPDSSDRSTVVYSDVSGTSVKTRNIKTDLSYGSESIPDSTCDTADTVISNVVIDSAGVAYFPYIDASNQLSLADAQTAVDSPTWTTFTDVSDNTVFGHGRTSPPYAAFFIAAKTDELHIIYVKHDGQSIRHVGDVQGGGGTDSEVIAAATHERVSGSYFSGLDKIGFLYDVSGVTTFAFHDLGDAGDTFNESVTEAIQFNDSLVVQVDFEPSLTEAVQYNDVAGAGSSIFQPSVTEAVQYDDTVDGQVDFEPAVTEAVQYNDTVVGGLVFDATITEAVQYNDVVTETVDFEPSVTEAVTFDDTPTETVDFEPSITEAVQYNDTVSAPGSIFQPSVTESVQYNDAPTETVDFEPAITEDVTFDDAVDGDVAKEASITESISFDDVVTAPTSTYDAGVTEAVQYNDAVEPGFIAEVSVFEAVQYNDTSGAAASVYEDNITEAIQFADTTGAAGSTYEVAIAEGVQFNDSVDGEVTKEASITETISFNDTVSATGSIYDVQVTEAVQYNDTVGAAGSVYGDGVTESVQYNDSPTETVDFEPAISEGVTFDDGVVDTLGPAVHEVSITEGITFNDTPSSAGSIYSVVIIEAVEYNDAVVADTILDLTITEAVTFQDVVITAGSVYEGAVTEAVQYNDSPTETVDFEPTVTEDIQFNDALIGQTDFEPAITESVEYNDSVIGQVDFEPGITEAVQYNDTVSTAGSVYEAVITESVQYNDALAETVDFEPAITEAVSFDDTPTETVDFEPTITEGVQFNDALDDGFVPGGGPIEASITESVVFNDTVEAKASIYESDITEGITFDDAVELDPEARRKGGGLKIFLTKEEISRLRRKERDEKEREELFQKDFQREIKELFDDPETVEKAREIVQPLFSQPLKPETQLDFNAIASDFRTVRRLRILQQARNLKQIELDAAQQALNDEDDAIALLLLMVD